MKHKIKTETRVPIISWAKEIDERTLEQAINLADLPFAYHHVAVMADAHMGYGMPIGGVLAAENAIIPNAVGVDIGCGVRICETNLKYPEMVGGRTSNAKETVLHTILSQISRDIPLGFRHHNKKQEADLFKKIPKIEILLKEEENAKTQVGTLGGGNHFIEIQRDEDNNIYLMVHSGSRNYGKKTADHYYKRAIEYDKKNNLEITHKELSWFPFDSKEGREYFEAMNFCLDFAKENRKQMMGKVENSMKKYIPDFESKFVYNIHHNYASKENHFGKEVIVHRKGATQAKKDQICLIPGSMGTKSYIAKGLGSPDSFESCSHGAGRTLGRKEAKRKITVQHVMEHLKEQNVLIFTPSKRDLPEEAAEAYKNIEEVMSDQKDLVEITHELTPLGVVKG